METWISQRWNKKLLPKTLYTWLPDGHMKVSTLYAFYDILKYKWYDIYHFRHILKSLIAK